ncbi:hypothetical protein [Micromonospora aurantiaca (nom. illeg.)]|nr:hypothetical protein [Micromonospora aurantiaca]
MDHNDFYEEDEPVEEVIAAFEQAEKGRTALPTNGVTEYLMITGLVLAGRSQAESRTTVNLVAA